MKRCLRQRLEGAHFVSIVTSTQQIIFSMNKEPKTSAECRFEDFALRVYPFLQLSNFHRTYYRILEAYARGQIRKLIVSVPPQHGKSVGATTLLPAYMLGIDPDMRIAIASYSGTLASKFNRRVQRIIESREYAEIFPDTTIKQGSKPLGYIRTSDEVEIIGHKGELLSVGREGSLTGNRVDCFILDDLYKDAMEAQSPIVRSNCWEWYTSVVRTRMHNTSRELIVFTRWHEEDLIGQLMATERVRQLNSFSDIDNVEDDEWLYLNFEAIKASPQTEIDPRTEGDVLWPEQHDKRLLLSKRRLDPQRFEAMYQGHPASREGMLYNDKFREYDSIPRDIVKRGCYIDTADTGDDYLCAVAYAIDTDGVIYITDVVYTQQPMEVSERLVAAMLAKNDTRIAYVESNNGGRGFARALQRQVPKTKIEWFHQSGNKEARILSNSATVLHTLRMPRDWHLRWPEFYTHLTTYKRLFKANAHDDAADALTGVIEREVGSDCEAKWKRAKFI